jgi:hypothetical protein
MGVGAAIGLGARESRGQGEGRQGMGVVLGDELLSAPCSGGQSTGPYDSRGGRDRDEPDKSSGNTGGGSRESLESPLPGNWHGGFGGGREETPLGCAPCSYLTRMQRRKPLTAHTI